MASLDYAYRRLVNTLGPERVARSEFDRMVYSHDFASLPKVALLQWKLYPDFVALPQTTEEVAALVRLSDESLLQITPSGRRHRLVRRLRPEPRGRAHRHAEDEPGPRARLGRPDRDGRGGPDLERPRGLRRIEGVRTPIRSDERGREHGWRRDQLREHGLRRTSRRTPAGRDREPRGGPARWKTPDHGNQRGRRWPTRRPHLALPRCGRHPRNHHESHDPSRDQTGELQSPCVRVPGSSRGGPPPESNRGFGPRAVPRRVGGSRPIRLRAGPAGRQPGAGRPRLGGSARFEGRRGGHRAHTRRARREGEREETRGRSRRTAVAGGGQQTQPPAAEARPPGGRQTPSPGPAFRGG